jgi:hypothetical protein
MSAQEIIEQIKALPAEEQETVAEFTKSLVRPAARQPKIRPGFEKMAREIFDEYDDLFRELAK